MEIALKTDQKCLQFLHIWPDSKPAKKARKTTIKELEGEGGTTTLIDEHVQQILPPFFHAA